MQGRLTFSRTLQTGFDTGSCYQTYIQNFWVQLVKPLHFQCVLDRGRRKPLAQLALQTVQHQQARRLAL